MENQLLKTLFLGLISFVLMRKSLYPKRNVMKTTYGFGYDIQITCGFYLGFHWVSKVVHVTNLSTFDRLLST